MEENKLLSAGKITSTHAAYTYTHMCIYKDKFERKTALNGNRRIAKKGESKSKGAKEISREKD